MYCVGTMFVQYLFPPLTGKVPKFCPPPPCEIKLLQAAGAGVPVGGLEPEGDGGGAGDTLGLAPTLSEGVGEGVPVGVGEAEGQGGSYASVALVTLWKVATVPVAAVKPQKADEERSDACKLMGVLRTLRAPPLGVVLTVRVPPAAHAS